MSTDFGKTWKRWCYSAATAAGIAGLTCGAAHQLIAGSGFVQQVSHRNCSSCGQGLCRCGSCRCGACVHEWHRSRPGHMQPHAHPSAPNYLPGTHSGSGTPAGPGTTMPTPPDTGVPNAPSATPPSSPGVDTAPQTPSAPQVNTDNFFPGGNNAGTGNAGAGLNTGGGSLTSSLASSSTDGPAIPNMIGDFFGSSGSGVSTLPGGSSAGTTTITQVQGSIFNLQPVFGPPDFSSASEYNYVANTLTNFSLGPNPLGLTSADLQASFNELFATNAGSPSPANLNDALPITSFLDAPPGLTFQSGSVIINDPSLLTGDASLIFEAVVSNPGLSDAINGEIFIVVPNPGTSGVVVGRQKVAENTSPLPRDRVYMNYSYFDNVPLSISGVNVNRVSPGFEKTFCDGQMSFEMRFPFASTLNSDITIDGPTSDDEIEFGNITMYLKALLYADQDVAVSAGLGMAVPTADDIVAKTRNGTRILQVENQSVHLLPFLGGVWTPTEDLFVQGFFQFDFDANGNDVLLNQGNGLQRIGTANDTSFLFVDVGVGYYAYRAADRSAALQTIVPTVEMHYNRSLQKTDVVSSGAFRVGSFADDIQILNTVIGATAQFNNDISVTAAYVTPMGNSADQQFDGEFRLLLNWYFDGDAFNNALPLGNFLQ